ncbi:MAG: Rne/Rng family ribonuclease [Nitrospiraceae bacterium]|nr:Rne/Rng family ribonuclease [Nitrospiraceae bacterium]
MKKKILIDAKYPEEKRVAIIEADRLVDFYVELATKEHLRGNIYKGTIARVEPSLQAVFVDFGQKKNGFLQLREIKPEYFGPGGRNRKVRMQEVFQKGQELIVQVEKDQRETKGASLTTYISLPGRYIVMMPGQNRIGISRKIGDEDRQRLKQAFGTLKVPEDTGFIVRTAGIDKTADDLSNDLKYLTKLWNEIQKEAASVKAPALIYKEQDIAIRTVRDYLTPDVEEVLVDDQETFRNIKSFLRRTLPGQRKINVRYYKDKRPIFDLHNLEDQIAKINERYVHLPSRGYLVFDRTEALTAIDVNSGRSRKEKNIEQTALRTNLEAADEIARQLRLRDMGGLVVIDFIDMEASKNRRQVEARLKDALLADKAHTDITGISRFGIVEMTRERMRTAFFESAYRKCPTCEGSGVLMAEEMVSLSAFREIHMKASRGGLELIVCHIPVGGANYLLNEKRDGLMRVEKDFKIRINVIGDPSILPGQYKIEVHKAKIEAEKKEAVSREKEAGAPQRQQPPREPVKEPVKTEEKTEGQEPPEEQKSTDETG